jgi:hypothetical protein
MPNKYLQMHIKATQFPSSAVTLGAAEFHTAEAIIAGITPTPYPDPNLPCPDSPMSMGGDFPLASANSQATEAMPILGNPWHPPYFKVKVSVFDLLNYFQTCWFLLWDHITKNIVEAQKAPNG